MLEGSRRSCSGKRIRLDLTDVPGLSLFPGQIVLARGINHGSVFIVQQLACDAPAPAATTSGAQLHKFHTGKTFMDGHELSLVVASGPFTTDDNLEYQPLADLVQYARDKVPDVLVLVGPFVDEAHVKVQSYVEHTYEDLFRAVVSEKIMKPLVSLPITVILVPGVADVHHDRVFPARPFPFDAAELTPRPPKGQPSLASLHLVANPATFALNEVVFAVSSLDTLHAMRVEECHRPGPGIVEKRFPRLAQHLIRQQSHFPLFPATDVPVDVAAQGAMRLPVTPDVLLVPYLLMPFATAVDSTVVVNPGRLGRGGSTFSHFTIAPIPADKLIVSDKRVTHDVPSRTAVHIYKI